MGVSPELDQALLSLKSASEPTKILFNAWLSGRGGALVPCRSDIDPLSIPAILPSVWVYEYRAVEDDFFCVIAGEEIEHAWGTYMRGVPFREIVGPENHAPALSRWKAVLEVPQIQYGCITEEIDGNLRSVAERLVLPLRDEQGAVTFTIGVSVYPYRQDDRVRTPPVWADMKLIPCRDVIDLTAL